jgi:hypothetical protein
MRSPTPSVGNRRQSEDVMIEVYLFLAVFPVQILGMSVLYPLRLSRVIRTGLKNIPAERLAEFYPGVDVSGAHDRFLTRYRMANTIVAVLGLLLWSWFISYMNQPGWDAGRVGGMILAYFMLQQVPTILLAWFTVRFNKVHRRWPLSGKRKASLQRRGLFDYVSPLLVVIAILSNSLFAAFMFYVARDPFPGFAGPIVNIVLVTLTLVLAGFGMYWAGRKRDPLQSHADHLRKVSMLANVYVWMCILMPQFVSMAIARQLWDLKTWGPFSGSIAFLLIGLLSLRSLSAPPQPSGVAGLGSSPAHQ